MNPHRLDLVTWQWFREPGLVPIPGPGDATVLPIPRQRAAGEVVGKKWVLMHAGSPTQVSRVLCTAQGPCCSPETPPDMSDFTVFSLLPLNPSLMSNAATTSFCSSPTLPSIPSPSQLTMHTLHHHHHPPHHPPPHLPPPPHTLYSFKVYASLAPNSRHLLLLCILKLCTTS